MQYLTDGMGKSVTFHTSRSLGKSCQGYYQHRDSLVPFEGNTCFLGGWEFYAEEDYFGGIAVRPKKKIHSEIYLKTGSSSATGLLRMKLPGGRQYFYYADTFLEPYTEYNEVHEKYYISFEGFFTEHYAWCPAWYLKSVKFIHPEIRPFFSGKLDECKPYKRDKDFDYHMNKWRKCLNTDQ